MDSLWSLAVFGMLSVIIYQQVKIKKKIISLNKWHTLAFTDDLTGLQNHTAYSRKINVLQSKKISGWSLVLFDIDNFKLINDTYGHLEGDKILKSFAKLLTSTFSGQDYSIYRIGGDEFAVISNHSNETLINQLISEITRAELNRMEFASTKGFAMYLENDTFADVFKRADRNLYHNKKIKKDSWRCLF